MNNIFPIPGEQKLTNSQSTAHTSSLEHSIRDPSYRVDSYTKILFSLIWIVAFGLHIRPMPLICLKNALITFICRPHLIKLVHGFEGLWTPTSKPFLYAALGDRIHRYLYRPVTSYPISHILMLVWEQLAKTNNIDRPTFPLSGKFFIDWKDFIDWKKCVRVQ